MYILILYLIFNIFNIIGIFEIVFDSYNVLGYIYMFKLGFSLISLFVWS